jgi:hypothetical protein
VTEVQDFASFDQSSPDFKSTHSSYMRPLRYPSSSMVYICVTARVGNCPMVTCLSSITSPQLPFTDEGVSPPSLIHSPVHANFTPVGNISSVFPSTLQVCLTAISTRLPTQVFSTSPSQAPPPQTILSKQTLCIHTLRYPQLA